MVMSQYNKYLECILSENKKVTIVHTRTYTHVHVHIHTHIHNTHNHNHTRAYTHTRHTDTHTHLKFQSMIRMMFFFGGSEHLIASKTPFVLGQRVDIRINTK